LILFISRENFSLLDSIGIAAFSWRCAAASESPQMSGIREMIRQP